MAAVLNGIAKFVFLLVLIFAVLLVIGLAQGDGLPANMVLTLDLRQAVADFGGRPAFRCGGPQQTVMDFVFALDDASRDSRIKGVVMRLGNGACRWPRPKNFRGAAPLPRSQEIRHRPGHRLSHGPGLGDYVAAAAADEIWVQPKSDFKVSGGGVGEIFLSGLLDKVQAVPQMAKRAEYKSAADMYMEKSMTDADKEQLTAGDEILVATRRWPRSRPTAISIPPRSAPLSMPARNSPKTPRPKAWSTASAMTMTRWAPALGRAGAGAKPVKITDYIKAAEFQRRLSAPISR